MNVVEIKQMPAKKAKMTSAKMKITDEFADAKHCRRNYLNLIIRFSWRQSRAIHLRQIVTIKCILYSKWISSSSNRTME